MIVIRDAFFVFSVSHRRTLSFRRTRVLTLAKQITNSLNHSCTLFAVIRLKRIWTKCWCYQVMCMHLFFERSVSKNCVKNEKPFILRPHSETIHLYNRHLIDKIAVVFLAVAKQSVSKSLKNSTDTSLETSLKWCITKVVVFLFFRLDSLFWMLATKWFCFHLSCQTKGSSLKEMSHFCAWLRVNNISVFFKLV